MRKKRIEIFISSCLISVEKWYSSLDRRLQPPIVILYSKLISLSEYYKLFKDEIKVSEFKKVR